MMDFSQYLALVKEIQLLGYDEDTAADWAAIIGDTPVIDEDGLVVVANEDGSIAARLRLPGFRL